MGLSVKLYSLSTCGHCKAVKHLLDELGIQYEYTDVDLLETEDRASAVAEVKRINPRSSFPTLIIGDRVVVGNREQEIREALGL
ncbi:MAG: glutaredoxin family protein [Syntrophales bacterium]|jgi:glutaredoxin|nr:glutaredoxin family protein [Syntrophales bacterium]MCK9528420.1 glutaredoxin family protein [Syntrophales bacterium]MDX9922443.1 glutaredoxin family protein [Syntrophales bacterium]